MEPVLDELTLVDCRFTAIGNRIQELAKSLSALDRLGAPRVVRTVSDVRTRVVAGGYGLSKWCFDASVDRDAGRFLAGRLSAQPYIDGPGGLMVGLEEGRALECHVNDHKAIGLGYCYLTEGFPVGLSGASFQRVCDRNISVFCISEAEEWTKNDVVRLILSEVDVESDSESIVARLNSRIMTGQQLLERAPEMLPNLHFGKTAVEQLIELAGTELHYSHILRHLRALQSAASVSGGAFTPAVDWSVESRATLNHRKFGPMRDFPWPEGHEGGRWSKHTKVGPNAYRVYFEVKSTQTSTEVCVGYIGPHLPTVSDPN